MTILEFPQAAGSLPRIPDSETKRQLDGFCDLENSLCDCVTMASIAAQIAANSRADGELISFVTPPKCSTRSRSNITPPITAKTRSSRSSSTKRQAARLTPGWP